MSQKNVPITVKSVEVIVPLTIFQSIPVDGIIADKPILLYQSQKILQLIQPIRA